MHSISLVLCRTFTELWIGNLSWFIKQNCQTLPTLCYKKIVTLIKAANGHALAKHFSSTTITTSEPKKKNNNI